MVLDEVKVSLTSVADQHFGGLPHTERVKAANYIKRLRNAGLGDATPLRHVSGLIWRKKLGDIRILFTFDKRKREIVIRAVMWRREDTYDDLNKLVREVEAEKVQRQAIINDQTQKRKKLARKSKK
jgi:mRNA-degrading endonuclease RelE of RelBE toxin-antitoxin system